jgi:hypothetical protein
MGMAIFEMLFNQDCRLESTCVSIVWLGWLLLGRPKGRRGPHGSDRYPAIATLEKAQPDSRVATL